MSFTRSTLVDSRRHTGLEQLMKLAATVHTFLGPIERYKFIEDEDGNDSVMVCSCFRLLENLNLTCSVGHLLTETVSAHQKVFHSGSGSLVFLAGAWSKTALECLHQGISIPCILSAMSEGLEICLQQCKDKAVPVDTLFHLGVAQNILEPHSKDFPFSREGSLPEKCSISDCGVSPNLLTQLSRLGNPEAANRQTGTQGAKVVRSKIKLTHSRHFTSNDTTDSERPINKSVSRQNSLKHTDMNRVAAALSHGCHKAMDLVLQASRIQSSMGGLHNSRRMFDVSKLNTCPLPGVPEDQACVLSGYVTLLSDEQASLATRLEKDMMCLALLNGDLNEKYRHLGFNRPAGGVQHVTDKLDVHAMSREQEWLNSALASLVKYNISVVLVTGVASKQLADECSRHDILLIERVRPVVLHEFARTTGAVPVTYITQLNQRCVGSGVRLQVWREYHTGKGEEYTAVSVTADHLTLVTAVIGSSVHGKVQSLEDCFWGCAQRLQHALNERQLLRGGGLTEMHCIQELQKHADCSSKRSEEKRQKEPYVGTVLQLMADGLLDYVSTLLCNSGQVLSKADAWTEISKGLKDPERDLGHFEKILDLGVINDGVCEQERVYDNLTVKMEAWRRALDLVFLVLQTDCEIITGVNAELEDDLQSKGFLIL